MIRGGAFFPDQLSQKLYAIRCWPPGVFGGRKRDSIKYPALCKLAPLHHPGAAMSASPGMSRGEGVMKLSSACNEGAMLVGQAVSALPGHTARQPERKHHAKLSWEAARLSYVRTGAGMHCQPSQLCP
jgi:hypothetical protein